MIVLMTRHHERFKGQFKLSDNEDMTAVVKQAFPTVHDVSDRVDTWISEEHAKSLRLAALFFKKGLLTKAELEEWDRGAEEDTGGEPDRIGSSGAEFARGSLDAGYGSFDDGGEDGTVRLRAKSSDVRSRGGTRDWENESGGRRGSEEQNM